jgi:hypothetical protein
MGTSTVFRRFVFLHHAIESNAATLLIFPRLHGLAFQIMRGSRSSHKGFNTRSGPSAPWVSHLGGWWLAEHLENQLMSAASYSPSLGIVLGKAACSRIGEAVDRIEAALKLPKLRKPRGLVMERARSGTGRQSRLKEM